MHDVLYLSIDGLGPFKDIRKGLISRGHLSLESGIAQLGFPGHPFLQRIGFRDLDVACLNLVPILQKMKGIGKRWKSVDAASLAVEIHKLPNLTGILAHRLKSKMFDEHGGKAFLMLDLHAVEDTAIGVNTDKKFLGGFKRLQLLSCIAHGSNR